MLNADNSGSLSLKNTQPLTKLHIAKYQLYVRMKLFISISQIINNKCNDKPKKDDCQCKKQETSPENWMMIKETEFLCNKDGMKFEKGI